MGLSITNAVAQAMLLSLGAQADAGTAAVINIYSGTVPTNADATLSGNIQLAQLVCNANIFSGVADVSASNLARATFAAITPDSSADASGTATFLRIFTQNAGVAIAQATVGVTGSGADLILNTTSITAGSQVSITSASIDLPEGP